MARLKLRTFSLTHEADRELQEIAAKQQRSVANVVKCIIEKALKENKENETTTNKE